MGHLLKPRTMPRVPFSLLISSHSPLSKHLGFFSSYFLQELIEWSTISTAASLSCCPRIYVHEGLIYFLKFYKETSQRQRSTFLSLLLRFNLLWTLPRSGRVEMKWNKYFSFILGGGAFHRTPHSSLRLIHYSRSSTRPFLSALGREMKSRDKKQQCPWISSE